MTETDLVKVWWWRRPHKEVFPEPNSAQKLFGQKHLLVNEWDWGLDHAAFSYELARRANRDLPLKSYPQLLDKEVHLLMDEFMPGKSRSETCAVVSPYYEIGNSGTGAIGVKFPTKSPAGFSAQSIWKLDIPDNTLKKVFLRFIHGERKRLGIKVKRAPGDTIRSPAWNYCEILDRFDLIEGYGAKGTDPERIRRRAKSEARRMLFRFVHAVLAYRKNVPQFPIWSELPDSLLTKAIRR